MGNTEQSRLKSSRPRSDQSGIRMLQKTIRLFENDFHIRITYVLLVVFGSNGRSTRQDKLIVRKSGSSFQHTRQIILYLLFPASRQKGDYRLIIQLVLRYKFFKVFRICFLIRSNFIYRRIAYIMNRVLMFSFKKFHFERKDREKLVHITLYILDTVLFPCPYLRRNIIVNRNLRLGMHEFGNIEVESRIVYQDYYIRIPGNDILLATFHVCKNGAQMKQHRNKTHISQFLIMLNHCSADSRHQVAPEKTEISLRVFCFQGRHQMGCMQVAGCFADNQIILHI